VGADGKELVKLSFNLMQMLRDTFLWRDGFYVEVETTERTRKLAAKVRGGRGWVECEMRKGEVMTSSPRLELWLRNEMQHSTELTVDRGREFIGKETDIDTIRVEFEVEWQS
jgi:hypothetical protein